MGYRVSKVSRLKGPQFKIRYEWFDASGRHSKALSKGDWASVGFSPSMSFEEAQARMRQLNSSLELKRIELRRNKIHARIKEETLAHNAFLGERDVAEFENDHLLGRFANNAKDKTASYWKRAKAILAELRIEPHDWAYRKEAFYDAFAKHQFSPAYVQKLLFVLNRWGAFISRKHQKFFDPIPAPRGKERIRIANQNAKKENRRGNKESEPLTPGALDKERGNLKPEQYNWLYLSVWFGLRPYEVDFLKDPTKYRIEREAGVQVLWVYQSKLEVAVEEKKRWKPIPCFLPQQKEGLKIIEAGDFEAPLTKTLVTRFGAGVGKYAGRKGFTDLMLDKGQAFEDISIWMGHTRIDRTWNSYKDKQRVRFKKAA
jgi:hypothetical protein